MALKIKNRVRELVVAAGGTGTHTLPGSADTGFLTFASQYSNTDTAPCICVGKTSGALEWGIYTYNAGTLARTYVLGSTAAGSPINWAAGEILEVFVTTLADLGQMTDRRHNLTATAVPSTGDDLTLGYAPGSLWLAEISSLPYAFMCRSAGVGAAVWEQVWINAGLNGTIQFFPFGGSPAVTGDGSLAIGYSVQVSADFAVALGIRSYVTALGGIAIGKDTGADDEGAVAIAFSGGGTGSAGQFITDALGKYSRALGGLGGTADWSFSDAWGGGGLDPDNNKSIGQEKAAIWLKSTTDATPVEMELGNDKATYGYAKMNTMTNQSAWTFLGTAIARNVSNGDVASWNIYGSIKNTGGTVALQGTPTITDSGHAAGMAACVFALSADNTNKCLKATVTGIAATDIDWVLALRGCEILRYT